MLIDLLGAKSNPDKNGAFLPTFNLDKVAYKEADKEADRG